MCDVDQIVEDENEILNEVQDIDSSDEILESLPASKGLKSFMKSNDVANRLSKVACNRQTHKFGSTILPWDK